MILRQRIFVVILLFILPCATARGTEPKHPAPVTKQLIKTDLYGDPLPAGAFARLGSLRFRHRGEWDSFGFRRDYHWYLVTHKGKHLVLYHDLQGVIHATEIETARDVGRFQGQDKAEKILAAAPNGEVFATGNLSDVRVWDLSAGKVRYHLRHSKVVTAAQFTPDGKALITWCSEETWQVWNVATAKLSSRLDGHEGEEVLISANSRTFVRQLDRRSFQWGDVATGKVQKAVSNGNDDPCLYISPDGKVIASTTADPLTVRLWETETGKSRDVNRCDKDNYGFRFSPDSRLLAVLAEHGHKILFCNIRTDKEFISLPISPYQINSYQFSFDGSMLAVIDKCYFQVWDTRLRKLLLDVPMHSAYMHENWPIAFSSDGSIVATGDGASLRFWNPATGRELPVSGGHQEICSLAFSPDGKVLASAAVDGSIRLWDIRTGCHSGTIDENGAGQLVFAPDGKQLACYRYGKDLEIYVWDIKSRRMLSQIHQDLDFGMGGTLGAEVAFSPDGKNLTAVSNGKAIIQIWDPTTGNLSRSLAGSGTWPQLVGFAYSPDGKSLVYSDYMSTINWLEASTEQTLATTPFKESGIERFFFSPDSKLLGVIDENQLVLMETATRQAVHKFLPDPAVYEVTRAPAGLEAVTMTPDGRVLAIRRVLLDRELAQVEWDLCDLGANRRINRFQDNSSGFCHYPDAFAFSPNGKVLAMARAGMVLLWDLDTLGGTVAAPAKHLKLQELERLYSQLAGANAARAYHAIHTLAAAPADTVPFLQNHLRPEPGTGYARLIADLDDPHFNVRDAASRELRRIGLMAEPALEKALRDTLSSEVRRRVRSLLTEAHRQPLSPELLRQTRAIQILEHIGFWEAKKVLELLHGGSPDAWLTQESAASLERLARR